MLKDQTHLGFPILLLGTALLSLLIGTTSAPATTLSSDKNSASAGTDVGAAFTGSNSIGAGQSASSAKNVWTILGIGTNGLSLHASPNATGTFATDGSTVFKNVSSSKGQQQSGSSGFKGIDLCVSSSSCGGQGLQNGLHASTILAAASVLDPKATLKSLFPITFQTPGRTHVIGNVGVVPLPATLPLLAAAIGGLAIVGRRWRPK